MLELILNPKRAEKRPWHMFLIGIIYGSLSMLIAYGFFSKDYVNSQYLGWIVVLFSVMFTIPFLYHLLRNEERKDEEYEQESTILREHGHALYALLWLFLGFVIAFSFWHIVLPDGTMLLKAQIEMFCSINQPENFEFCIQQYGIKGAERITGLSSSNLTRLALIFSNNVKVLMVTILFSLIFGAGAIFILSWNASVIAAAIGIFTRLNALGIPRGILRYMVHGIVEIAAYFVGALAGGILSIAIVKGEYRTEKFWKIMQDFLVLILSAILILIIAGIIEVFITPYLFKI